MPPPTWDPDAVAPPVGDVYSREAPPEWLTPPQKSALLVAIGIIAVVAGCLMGKL